MLFFIVFNNRTCYFLWRMLQAFSNRSHERYWPGLHLSKQCFSVAKLFSFPWQPWYRKYSQVPVFMLKHQRYLWDTLGPQDTPSSNSRKQSGSPTPWAEIKHSMCNLRHEVVRPIFCLNIAILCTNCHFQALYVNSTNGKISRWRNSPIKNIKNGYKV